jgi:superfamily I DNA and/or RNA helicase
LIRNELNKQKRHIPIRDLVARAAKTLQTLKPVWLMSPMSVAQYVPPGSAGFDLVIIDEASQMRPEYAVGAIARGAQVVVVGDPKQLPPTDFFQSHHADPDADAEVAVESESILDLALAPPEQSPTAEVALPITTRIVDHVFEPHVLRPRPRCFSKRHH